MHLSRSLKGLVCLTAGIIASTRHMRLVMSSLISVTLLGYCVKTWSDPGSWFGQCCCLSVKLVCVCVCVCLCGRACV